jgi:hypothetical protein
VRWTDLPVHSVGCPTGREPCDPGSSPPPNTAYSALDKRKVNTMYLPAPQLAQSHADDFVRDARVGTRTPHLPA